MALELVAVAASHHRTWCTHAMQSKHAAGDHYTEQQLWPHISVELVRHTVCRDRAEALLEAPASLIVLHGTRQQDSPLHAKQDQDRKPLKGRQLGCALLHIQAQLTKGCHHPRRYTRPRTRPDTEHQQGAECYTARGASLPCSLEGAGRFASPTRNCKAPCCIAQCRSRPGQLALQDASRPQMRIATRCVCAFVDFTADGSRHVLKHHSSLAPQQLGCK